MIFFNPTLMPTPETALLFMVHNPVPLKNYDDHQAALYIQLHEVIQRSMEEADDPIYLIENYLDVYYNGGTTVDEIAAFLIEQDLMKQALFTLRNNWKAFDPKGAAESIAEEGLSKADYMERYGALTLRTYLETLSSVFNSL